MGKTEYFCQLCGDPMVRIILIRVKNAYDVCENCRDKIEGFIQAQRPEPKPGAIEETV